MSDIAAFTPDQVIALTGLSARQLTSWDRMGFFTFYVFGRSVCFDDPRTGTRVDGKMLGQTLFSEIPVLRVEQEMRAAANQLRERTAEEIGKIAQIRSVMSHAPVLAGTRIPTSAVWNFHQAGYSPVAIIEQYPSLTSEDVMQAIAYEKNRRARVG